MLKFSSGKTIKMGKFSTRVLLLFIHFYTFQFQVSLCRNLGNPEPEIGRSCNLSETVIAEIQSYQSLADKIIDTVVKHEFKGRTYDQLAKFVDLYPHRLTGSDALERSIDYIIAKSKKDGIENVTTENVQAPLWIRGEEAAEMVGPARKKFNILGLAPTVGTPPEGITAEVIVVHNYTELEEMKHLVPGKIVVYNSGWLGSYGETVVFRGGGAVAAAEYGGVAALVESVTPYSLDTPHTGGTNYNPNVTQIPIASITREDAEMLSRLYARGEKIVVHLTMLDELRQAPATTRNTFAQIAGRERPEEIVVISGHIDDWDVGQGAQDDAGGVMITSEALAVIQHLGLQPRRTLQAIYWTAEEQGLIGAQSFINEHRSEMGRYVAAFESDTGIFKPLGLDFAGNSQQAGCMIQEILKLLKSINATAYARYPVVGTDIVYMIEEGVPGLSLNTDTEKYFYYHHSPADTMMAEDPDHLDLATALWAVTSYVIADLSVALPRN